MPYFLNELTLMFSRHYEFLRTISVLQNTKPLKLCFIKTVSLLLFLVISTVVFSIGDTFLWDL